MESKGLCDGLVTCESLFKVSKVVLEYLSA